MKDDEKVCGFDPEKTIKDKRVSIKKEREAPPRKGDGNNEEDSVYHWFRISENYQKSNGKVQKPSKEYKGFEESFAHILNITINSQTSKGVCLS